MCGSRIWEECRLRYLVSVGEGGILVAIHLCGVGEVVVRAIFPFPYLKKF
jgi:hypothetical protein